MDEGPWEPTTNRRCVHPGGTPVNSKEKGGESYVSGYKGGPTGEVNEVQRGNYSRGVSQGRGSRNLDGSRRRGVSTREK